MWFCCPASSQSSIHWQTSPEERRQYPPLTILFWKFELKLLITSLSKIRQHVCNLELLLDLKQISWKSQGWILDKPVIIGFNWNLTKNVFCEGGYFLGSPVYVRLYVMYLHQHVFNLEPLLDLKQNSWKSQGWILDKLVINCFKWNLTKNAFCEGGYFLGSSVKLCKCVLRICDQKGSQKIIDFQPNSDWKKKKTALKQPGSIFNWFSIKF